MSEKITGAKVQLFIGGNPIGHMTDDGIIDQAPATWPQAVAGDAAKIKAALDAKIEALAKTAKSIQASPNADWPPLFVTAPYGGMKQHDDLLMAMAVGMAVSNPKVAAQKEHLEKAMVHGPAVIAIGAQGGKIIGYDHHHKPIYLHEELPAPVHHTSPHGAPSNLISFLKALLGGGFYSPKVKISPHPEKPGVWVLDVPQQDAMGMGTHGKVDTFLLTGVTKGGATAAAHNVVVAKQKIPKKDGGFQLLIKSLAPAAAPKDHPFAAPPPADLKIPGPMPPTPAALPAIGSKPTVAELEVLQQGAVISFGAGLGQYTKQPDGSWKTKTGFAPKISDLVGATLVAYHTEPEVEPPPAPAGLYEAPKAPNLPVIGQPVGGKPNWDALPPGTQVIFGLNTYEKMPDGSIVQVGTSQKVQTEAGQATIYTQAKIWSYPGAQKAAPVEANPAHQAAAPPLHGTKVGPETAQQILAGTDGKWKITAWMAGHSQPLSTTSPQKITTWAQKGTYAPDGAKHFAAPGAWVKTDGLTASVHPDGSMVVEHHGYWLKLDPVTTKKQLAKIQEMVGGSQTKPAPGPPGPQIGGGAAAGGGITGGLAVASKAASSLSDVSVVQKPGGWGFVGKVPVKTSVLHLDGTLLSDEEANALSEAYKQVGGLALSGAGFKAKYKPAGPFPTKAAAEAHLAAVEAGITPPLAAAPAQQHNWAGWEGKKPITEAILADAPVGTQISDQHGNFYTLSPDGTWKNGPIAYTAIQLANYGLVGQVGLTPAAPVSAPPVPKPAPTYKVIKTLGGLHSAKLLSGSDGSKLVWKEAKNASGIVDKKLGDAEVGASQLAAIVTSGLVPEVRWMDHGGQAGIAQPYVDGLSSDFNPAHLTPTQAAQLMAHMLADWIVGNHDTHTKQFGIDPKGNVIGYDKGQAFKHFSAPGVQSHFAKMGQPEPAQLDPMWVGPTNDNPTYGAFAKAVATGQVQLDPQSPILKAAISAAEGLTAQQVTQALAPYATQAFKGQEQAFLSAVLDRAHGAKASVAAALKPMGLKPGQAPKVTLQAGMTVVDHTALTTKVNWKKSGTDSYQGATVQISGQPHVVIGRKRVWGGHYEKGVSVQAHNVFIVRGPDGKLQQMSAAVLANLDAAGKMTRVAGHPIYATLPDSAVVMKPDAKTQQELDGALGAKHNHTTYAKAIQALQGAGIHTLVAGGVVRDAIQGIAAMDVDVVVSAPYVAANDALIDAGVVKPGIAPKVKFQQSLVKVPDAGEGLDVASMRGPHYNAWNYSGTAMHGSNPEPKAGGSKFAAESASLADDVVSRDFAMNAIFYDPEQGCIIDVSGHGVGDAKAKMLRPPTQDTTAWLESNGPRNFARMIKFIGRGYTPTPELTKIFNQHFLAQDARDGAKKQWEDIQFKTFTDLPYDKAQKYRAAMKAWCEANVPSHAIRSKVYAYMGIS